MARLFSGNGVSPGSPDQCQLSLSDCKACFSPAVPSEISESWVSRGGSLVKRKENKPVVDYIFCRGRTDPWFPRRVVTEDTNCIYAYRPAPRLSQHAIVVFHSQWVVNVIAANFPVPIAPYVLNGRDYAHTTTSPSTSGLSSWESDPTEVSHKRSSTSSDDLSCRPFKKLCQERSGGKRRSLTYEDGPSSMTLVDEPLTVNIPFIDLYKVASKQPKRNSSTQLRISRISQANSTGLDRLGKQLPFESGPVSLPRLSVADALLGLQDIAIANSTVIQHGRQHLGKTLRCGFLP